MAGIQVPGLASGLDTAALVSQLMQVERIPRGRMERQQAAVQQRQDFLKDLSTKLKTLRAASTDLNSIATWSPTRTATSADSARVSARPSGGTITPGTYDVEVTALATASMQNWSVRSRPNATDLTITASSTGTATTVAIAANSSLDQIVTAINGSSASPVSAANDNGQLKLTSKALGASSGFTITGQALDVAGTAKTGTNAAYKVNGAAYTSSTNVATAGIPGVEITLAGLTTPWTPVRITTTETPTDKSSVAAKLRAFVDAYNAVVDFSRAKLAEKPNAKAATVTEAKVGVLYGDRGVTQVLHKLRNALMDPLTGHPLAQDEMHEIGLSTGGAVSTVQQERVAGRLTFDETKFTKAWETNRGDVEKLLRGGGGATEGFAKRMDDLLGPLVASGGIFEGRISGAQSELKTLADAMGRMDRRLSRKEEFYKGQFTQLETALAKAQSLQAQMAGQLAGLPSGSK
jgi:flagellar hook-associated protein 2